MARSEGEIPKAYEPSTVEGPLYQFWLDGGHFAPRIDPERQPFSIIMPPPNVTGELHLGHALTATMEDCLVRWHRMRGDPTLWLPGVDHAGIATQNVVERDLAKEGLSRQDLGRGKFVERVWEWVHKYRGVISRQHMRLGASCDWEREVFTMDEGPRRAVRTTFVNLYRDGLIYRGERMINWCPRCQTALSDLEVEHREQSAQLWYVRYPLLDDSGNVTGEHIVIATTRPETIVADVAVAVSPRAERWQKIVGRKALLPIIERPIPIIADDAVDPEFGTGALKITPGHDIVDFEIAERHGLPCIVSVGPDGRMNKEGGPYLGMDRFECRDVIVADLERLDLLERTEDYHHAIGRCDRCDTIVEPIVSEQWFVRMEPLARPAMEAVEDGRVQIIPRRFTRVYMNWMENIRDWCISRQLWWGHPIPVWYCDDCGGLTVAIDDPAACEKCGSGNLRQDPDVLDTWFSSALWPHSTLGWPEETDDLRYFYPTSVLETAYDILFFWVARMIMMGLYNMKDVPFRHVYLHGLIRDPQGRKMTKSLGNVVDPIQAIEQYGCDALRFVLATGGAPGNDFRLTDERLEGGRNFANKIWNASRFVIQSIGDERVDAPDPKGRADMPLEDRWIMSRLQRVVTEVDRLLSAFQIGEAGHRLHDFFWGEYCDWYVEMAKVRLKAGDRSPLPVLAAVLQASLRMLHPIMPFVTEAAWQHLRERMHDPEADSIMVCSFPQGVAELDPEAERRMAVVMEVVRAIRNIKAAHGLDPSKVMLAQTALPLEQLQEAMRQQLDEPIRQLGEAMRQQLDEPIRHLGEAMRQQLDEPMRQLGEAMRRQLDEPMRLLGEAMRQQLDEPMRLLGEAMRRQLDEPMRQLGEAMRQQLTAATAVEGELTAMARQLGDIEERMRVERVAQVIREVRNKLAHSVRFGETTQTERSTIDALARVLLAPSVPATALSARTRTATAQVEGGEIAVPLEERDLSTLTDRLSKQMAEAEGEVRRLEAKVGNAAFREKAPAPVVAREQEKLAAARARLEGLRQRLAELG